MNNIDSPEKSIFNLKKIIETLVRLSVLLLLIMWCIDILKPFVLILAWGGIIAIAMQPVYLWCLRLLGGKTVLTSIILTLLMLSVLVIPSWLVIDSLFDGINHLKLMYESGTSIIPAPGESTKSWPAFTQPLIDLWNHVSKNTTQVVTDHSDQIKKVALWLFTALSGIGQGVIQFTASIIITGVLFVYSQQIGESSLKIFTKLAGKNGNVFISDSVATIRNVVKGILGVAIIQATMAGIGFFAAGIPFAGLWTILSLILAIVQVGAGPIIIPVLIYSFSTHSTLTAVVLTIWLGIALFIDNILKPILLGRNAPAPMLVIFLGAIGGFISHGFIGLFLGAVILTLGYKLFNTWIESSESDSSNTEENTVEPAVKS